MHSRFADGQTVIADVFMFLTNTAQFLGVGHGIVYRLAASVKSG